MFVKANKYKLLLLELYVPMFGSYSPINLFVRNRTIIATKTTEKYLVWNISCVWRNTHKIRLVRKTKTITTNFCT